MEVIHRHRYAPGEEDARREALLRLTAAFLRELALRGGDGGRRDG